MLVIKGDLQENCAKITQVLQLLSSGLHVKSVAFNWYLEGATVALEGKFDPFESQTSNKSLKIISVTQSWGFMTLSGIKFFFNLPRSLFRPPYLIFVFCCIFLLGYSNGTQPIAHGEIRKKNYFTCAPSYTF